MAANFPFKSNGKDIQTRVGSKARYRRATHPHRGLAIRGTNNSVADVSRVRLSYEAAPQPGQPRGLVQVVLNE